MATRTADYASALRPHLYPLTGSAGDYDLLLDRIGDARFVLIGEASHGTDEFYRERSLITRRLVAEKGFHAVAAEADWPDAYRVNCYVRHASSAQSADEALRGFRRFPTWMWRNTQVVEFVDWLRAHNERRRRDQPAAGFYGLDLYSLYASIDAVVNYLDRVDPDAAGRARSRYACFDHAREDSQAYGFAASLALAPSCEDEAVRQLVELHDRAGEYARADGAVAEDELFHAVQNARVVRNAEEYYRSMFGSRHWNLRDRHMAETLEHLADFLDRRVGRSKIVVWAHNSHVGDARATQMGERGELNIGQLARESYGSNAVNIGFSTYTGTVTAASDWGEPAERKNVRPGLPGSYESLFHESGIPTFMLFPAEPATPVPPRLLQRAIGVIYRPETERLSHYFETDLARQFDCMLHFDTTGALEPLERTEQWTSGEPPETYPFAQ